MALDVERPIECADAMSLAEFDVLNRLVAMSGRRIGLSGARGGRGTGHERAMRLKLDIGGARTIVYLAGRREAAQHGWYAFDDITLAQRAELWALRGTRLMREFEQMIAAPVAIIEVEEGVVPIDWPRASLHLGPIELGCWFDAATAAPALVCALRHRKPLLPTLSFLFFKCALRLRGIRLIDSDFRGLAEGDLLVVTPDAAEPVHGELRVPTLGYRFPITYRKEGMVMIEHQEIVVDAEATGAELEDRKVELVVELATCQMTLGELANLKEGQALRLAKPASELTVALRYREVCVARGSLVEIAGLLGIRIEMIRMDAAV
ncbi:hypothetical protein C5615_36560 [Burkholderia cepacia]|uniref:Flagellar motor switch protein FliN-like C-terminal domain-containing protein n=2 Tax=Burkholderia cepacia TaxID=292 RepID=A0A2S8I0S6_BURCE|nr:hypothetical protein C5615_36560 [Burkholderia cepacia]HDR9511855.1 FliM/FliN family flagellar motor switch protein [Burkholderia cepacia]